MRREPRLTTVPDFFQNLTGVEEVARQSVKNIETYLGVPSDEDFYYAQCLEALTAIEDFSSDSFNYYAALDYMSNLQNALLSVLSEVAKEVKNGIKIYEPHMLEMCAIHSKFTTFMHKYRKKTISFNHDVVRAFAMQLCSRAAGVFEDMFGSAPLFLDKGVALWAWQTDLYNPSTILSSTNCIEYYHLSGDLLYVLGLEQYEPERMQDALGKLYTPTLMFFLSYPHTTFSTEEGNFEALANLGVVAAQAGVNDKKQVLDALYPVLERVHDLGHIDIVLSSLRYTDVLLDAKQLKTRVDFN